MVICQDKNISYLSTSLQLPRLIFAKLPVDAPHVAVDVVAHIDYVYPVGRNPAEINAISLQCFFVRHDILHHPIQYFVLIVHIRIVEIFL